MGQKSRNKKTKYPKRNTIHLLSKLSWNTKPSNLQITSEQKDATCTVRDCELPKLIALLADVATGIWRVKNKFSDVDIDGLPDEIKKAHRLRYGQDPGRFHQAIHQGLPHRCAGCLWHRRRARS